MNIVKTFTWPLSIKKALLLMSEAYYSERPIMGITYRSYDNEPTQIRGLLCNTNIMLPDCYRDDDSIIILILSDNVVLNHREMGIYIRDIIQLDIYDVCSDIFRR